MPACGNDEPDWYGRLYISWSGGGSPSTRLSDWLDPDGLGVSTLTLLEGGQGYVPPAEKANLRITGMAPNPFLDFVEFDVEVDRDATSTVRIYDVAGRLVVDLGRRNFEFGEDNKVAWGGDDADGARVASGHVCAGAGRPRGQDGCASRSHRLKLSRDPETESRHLTRVMRP